MVEFMYYEVKTTISKVFAGANYVALTCARLAMSIMVHGTLSMHMWCKIGGVFPI